MEELFQHIQEVLGVPAFLINQMTFLPDYIKEALITGINFVPWLYFLYYAIELLERFFLKNYGLFIRLIRRLGPVFGAGISIIPECGYSVIASTYYSRKMISRGTLLAFLIACSDDALPLLFIDLSKAVVVIPIVLIKLVLAIAVAIVVDTLFALKKDTVEGTNAMNIDLNIPGCCYHTISTDEHPPYWWMHPLTHTFNVFMFVVFSLAFLNCVIKGFGSAENLASYLMIDSPYQVVAGAVIGLIPNSLTSVFLALAYVKGVISFPTLLAGLITTAGIALNTLAKYNKRKNDNNVIVAILLIVAIATGLVIFFNMQFVSIIQEVIKQV